MKRLALAAILAASISCTQGFDLEVGDTKIPDNLRLRLSPARISLLEQAANSSRYRTSLGLNPNSFALYSKAISGEQNAELREAIAAFAADKLRNDAYQLINSHEPDEEIHLGLQRLTESIQIDPRALSRDRSISWGIARVIDEYHRGSLDMVNPLVQQRVSLGFLSFVYPYATSPHIVELINRRRVQYQNTKP